MAQITADVPQLISRLANCLGINGQQTCRIHDYMSHVNFANPIITLQSFFKLLRITWMYITYISFLFMV